MTATSLRVTRWAETKLSAWGPRGDELDPAFAIEEWLPINDESGKDPDFLAEAAGRSCYQSFARPNPQTASTRNYLAHIHEIGHESVLAHASVTYYIEGVTRTLTHELVRHRWPAFSQLSQRYVKVGADLDYVVPPLFRGNGVAEGMLAKAAQDALNHYNSVLGVLTSEFPDATSKQLREAARAVLPNMTETRIVVTANLRAWRDLLKLRLPPSADAEIRELAEALLADLKDYAPSTFQDIEMSE